MKRIACCALALAMTVLTGCQTAGENLTKNSYLEDRINDTIDILPISLSAGEGIYGGVRITSFFGTGLGYAETTRVGWARRSPVEGESPEEALRGYVEWPEETYGAILFWQRTDDPAPGAGNTAFFIPMRNTPSPADTLDTGSLLDVEADLQLWLIGARVALSPVEFADWLLGWGGIDIVKDDLGKMSSGGAKK